MTAGLVGSQAGEGEYDVRSRMERNIRSIPSKRPSHLKWYIHSCTNGAPVQSRVVNKEKLLWETICGYTTYYVNSMCYAAKWQAATCPYVLSPVGGAVDHDQGPYRTLSAGARLLYEDEVTRPAGFRHPPRAPFLGSSRLFILHQSFYRSNHQPATQYEVQSSITVIHQCSFLPVHKQGVMQCHKIGGLPVDQSVFTRLLS